MEKTRLAPSPTGALHLGNIRTFLINWALARAFGWSILLRIEDLDGPRVKPGATEALIDMLRWLGLDWDEGPIVQSQDMLAHHEAMSSLAAGGLAYPCRLTRSEIARAASAPHEGGGEARYPSSPRLDVIGRSFSDAGTNWRFVTEPGTVTFEDAFRGSVAIDVHETVGDFVIWTRRAQPAYQLAVVVDDHRQGVTQVVRGDDLVESTPRQLLLQEALGFEERPTYTHLPLVVGPDGRRLAKRHGDTRLAAYRSAGVHPERIIALVGRWCGCGEHERLDLGAFTQGLQLATIPRDPVIMTPEDHQWLLADAHG